MTRQVKEFFLDTDYTDKHGLNLYCFNNGTIVKTMLPFHKCYRIYEIKIRVICQMRVLNLENSFAINHMGVMESCLKQQRL